MEQTSTLVAIRYGGEGEEERGRQRKKNEVTQHRYGYGTKERNGQITEKDIWEVLAPQNMLVSGGTIQ